MVPRLMIGSSGFRLGVHNNHCPQTLAFNRSVDADDGLCTDLERIDLEFGGRFTGLDRYCRWHSDGAESGIQVYDRAALRGRLEQRDFACRALPRLHLLRRGNALHRAEIMRLKTEDSTEPLLPAERRGAVELSVRSDDQLGIRDETTFGNIRIERVQDANLAVGAETEDIAALRIQQAAFLCRAVEEAVAHLRHRIEQSLAVGTVEAIDEGKIPGGIALVDRAIADIVGAVEVAV